MGCDIHVMIEAKLHTQNRCAWHNVDNWRHNPYYGELENEPVMEIRPIFEDRNYELFSFLAGVRNYGNNPSFGFDRGIPEDAAKQTAVEHAKWGIDAHTAGYATLAELKDKIKTVDKVLRKGYVHKEQIQRHKDTGKTPDMWCQGIGNTFANLYEWYEWEDELTCFTRLIEAIEERKRDVFCIHDPEDDDGKKDADIRIVFWFDN